MKYLPYKGEVPESHMKSPHKRRRCPNWFSGCWQCELIEEHDGPHVSKAFEKAGRPFEDRRTGQWLIEVK
jgi:hypothetical protein